MPSIRLYLLGGLEFFFPVSLGSIQFSLVVREVISTAIRGIKENEGEESSGARIEG